MTKVTGREETEEANLIRQQILNTLDDTNEYFVKLNNIDFKSLNWRVISRLLSILVYTEILQTDHNMRLKQFEWWVYKENEDSPKINISEILANLDPKVLKEANEYMDNNLFMESDEGEVLLDTEEYFDNLVGDIVSRIRSGRRIFN